MLDNASAHVRRCRGQQDHFLGVGQPIQSFCGKTQHCTRAVPGQGAALNRHAQRCGRGALQAGEVIQIARAREVVEVENRLIGIGAPVAYKTNEAAAGDENAHE